MTAFHHRLRHHLRYARHRVIHHARNAFIPHEGNQFHPHALRRRSLHIVGGTLIAAKVLTVVFVSLYAGEARLTTISPSTIVTQTNMARSARGVAALKTNTALTKAAQAKANDMVANGYFAHISPKKVTPWYWFKKAGYSYTYAGENLAIDYASSEDVISAWLDSPTHRANLLGTRYKEIGVATATGVINGVESQVVVQMFGAPVATKPKVTTPKPTQTPDPVVTKKAIVKKPLVLGTETKINLTAPSVLSPEMGTLVRTAHPIIVGTTTPQATVIMMSGDTTIATGVAETNGAFSIEPVAALSDGAHQFSIRAQAQGVTSTSRTISFSVDTVAPEYINESSFAIPVIGRTNTYLVSVRSDATSLVAVTGAVVTPFQPLAGHHVGLVTVGDRGVMAGVIRLRLTDAAGNDTYAAVVNTERFTDAAVSAHIGPGTRALTTIFFSRVFLMMFFAFFLVVALVNVSMNWHRRHHPALLGILLVLYTAGTLLIL